MEVGDVRRTERSEDKAGDAGDAARAKPPLAVGWFAVMRNAARFRILSAYWKIWRSQLFDRDWYRRQNPDVDARGVDTLLHYILRGADEGRNPNPVFDGRWYLATHKDVASGKINPLLHYILHGAAEGRSISAEFSVQDYLAYNPDVAESGIPALQHYLRYGRKEGRQTGYHEDRPLLPRASRPLAPSPEAWKALAACRPANALPPVVDIVIPVYRSYDDTLACIHAVLTARNSTPHEIVVIDDCSPEPALSAMLDNIASLGLITLLRNDRNLGFVGTANRGMRLHADRDVILLNSDTVVYGDWIDRMLAHAGPRTGTITPLSGNATICSYPEFNRNNVEELEVPFEKIDRICADVNRGLSVNVPTGVGFCMYVSRNMLERIGYFDEESFRRGYGEENDLCRRAEAAGWRSIAIADVFVRHTGEVSFAASAREAQRAGMQALLRKHPDYLDRVRRFVRRDPLAAMRRRIDAARIGADGRRNVLFIAHTWGGGVERHMNDMAEMLAVSGVGVVTMRPRLADSLVAVISTPDRAHIPNLKKLDLAADIEQTAELLRLAGIVQIHVHSLAGWNLGILKTLPDLARRMGVPIDFTFHDFMAVCPRISLVDAKGRYCGGPSPSKCTACLKNSEAPLSRVSIADWQARFREFLGHTRYRFAPSRDTAGRMTALLEGGAISVRPHPQGRIVEKSAAVPWRQGERLRVAVPGALGLHKGVQILHRAAKDAKKRRLPIEYVVVGYSDRDAELERLENVRVTGAYAHAHLGEILVREKCHVAMIPSIWPETYSYTVTEMLEAGFAVAVFPFGAPCERLREIAEENAIMLPMSALDEPGLVNDTLLAHAEKLPAPLPVVTGRHDWTFDTYYRAE